MAITANAIIINIESTSKTLAKGSKSFLVFSSNCGFIKINITRLEFYVVKVTYRQTNRRAREKIAIAKKSYPNP